MAGASRVAQSAQPAATELIPFVGLDGTKIGCGTPGEVSCRMMVLFKEATTTDLVPGNFVAAQDLAFDHAVVEGKVARVYLKGTPSYAGVCDDPRVTVQIRETTLANAPAVDTVEIFLNGEKYEVPSEKGE